MRSAIASAGVAALMAAVPMASAAGVAPGTSVVPVTITATPGHADAVARALDAAGLPVVRRRGREVQVSASPDRLGLIRALPGVAAARSAPGGAGEGDPDAPGPVTATRATVRSEGFERVGADALQSLAQDGRGVTIAVLDLGFGTTGIAAMQARGELPPAARLETRSFDAVWGLAGRNVYGNATNHGELVAQTVYDYAPAANYVLANYHTEQDFQAAVDWLIQRRPDVVVHSNSFLEGPFDGSGPAAQAVDRAADAGIAWVNSAGNYGDRHWEGEWADADRDDVLDWPTTPGWTFTVAPGKPITFALSWDQADGAEEADLDLVLEKRSAGGGWVEVAASRDSQVDGARPSERLTGIPSGDGGEFRLRVVHAAGPEPSGRLTLFSREVTMKELGDPGPGSIPTPGDANGSITVGAVAWSTNSLRAYSSRGPTDDGRVKPDVVAPTNTSVRRSNGRRAVGGTSIAAPNAAGAIALIIGSRRLLGTPIDLAGLRDVLATDALDLGPQGPDDMFGAGRVRVDVDPPQIFLTARIPRVVTSLPVRVQGRIEDASRLALWSIDIDGRRAMLKHGTTPLSVALGRSRVREGRRTLEVRAKDWAGNTSVRLVRVLVDTRAPRIRLFRVERVGSDTVRRSADGSVRPARAVLVAQDVSASVLRISVAAADGSEVRRRVRFRGTARRRIPLGALAPGRYAVTITASDAAGHERTTTRRVRIGRW